MTKHTNTPALRFSEFENDWKIVKLQELLCFNNGINASKDQYGVGRKFINVLDILNNNFITYNNIIGKVDVSEKVELNNKVEYGDMLFLRSSETREEVGLANTYLDNKYALFGGFVIRGKRIKEYSPLFLKETLNKPRTRYEIGVAAGGSTRFNVSQDILKNVTLYLPELEEQRKISNFFSKLDRQIELEEEKLELLEQQKRGYMQKIFSQELRFKDDNGNDYPNWENEKLGDLINEVNERTTSNNQYVLLSSTKNGLLSQEEYFKKQIGSKDSTGYKILRLNQLVLSPQNLWLGNINFNQRFDIGIVSPSYRIYNLSNQFDINFAKDLLKSPRYIYEYAQASEQGASVVRRNLNLELFYSIKISLPSIEEQRKIGAFLNKLDKLMRKQYNKIEVLKQRKQGLLQKMFV
ncbi:restriction endonuclease subunit S [Staphylococcus hominis]|uniref:restriction endonuclease subunit S n=1 Tax=Staphylococcus hominis TaxID=1290 RepID=UPI00119FBB1C|nr:restriction endonuclease subunit S [Staphylococcus hominis]